MSDPFGIKKATKKQTKLLKEQEQEARESKIPEIQERLTRATDQIFRVFGRNAAFGGGSGRAGILG